MLSCLKIIFPTSESFFQKSNCIGPTKRYFWGEKA
nr:MAG TPA: Protein of unknown function (DUF3155) [Caudoviricetes sp.]